MLRFFSILIGVLVLLVVAAVLLVPMFVDKDQVIALAAKAIEEETGATLEINGDLNFSFFPQIGVAFSDAALTMPDKKEPDIEISAAQIGVQLLPLLSGEVKVDSISVDGLTARLATTPEARVDTSRFSDAQLEAHYAERRRATKEAGQQAGAVLAVPLALTVSSLQARNVTVISTDTTTGETSTLEVVALDARDLNLDGAAIPLDLSLRIPGPRPIDVSVKGDLSISQATERAEFSRLTVKVAGVSSEPLTLRLSGHYDLPKQAADTEVDLTLGEMKGGGSLRYASFESPQIDADLSLNLFDPVLFALAGPDATADADSAGSGDEPLPLDALRTIDTRAKLSIDKASFGDHDIGQLAVKLRALEGVVTISELSGEVHGGKLNATATFNGRLSNARLETRGGVQSLDLKSAMAASQSSDLLSGTASLNWELNGSGRTANELTASLKGPIQLDTDSIVLHGTSVEKLVCQAVALANQEQLTSTFSTDTAFTEMSATVQLADGKATLQPLRAQLPSIGLTGQGNFDLLEQDFKASFAARLSPGLEELDSACRVSKRLTAIDFPVKCRGSLADEPSKWCEIDSQKILRDIAVSEGTRKVEKKAGKLLNKWLQKRE